MGSGGIPVGSGGQLTLGGAMGSGGESQGGTGVPAGSGGDGGSQNSAGGVQARVPEGFVRVAVPKVERFCYGRARLCSDGEGYVRLALLKSYWTEGRTHVVFTGAIRLRAGNDGTIDSVHRADAFGASRSSEVAPQLFEARRNAAVVWILAEADWGHLGEFFRKKFGLDVQIERSLD